MVIVIDGVAFIIKRSAGYVIFLRAAPKLLSMFILARFHNFVAI
jgi:hypothetical protein